MPFDGFNFESERKQPERETSGERAFRILFLVVAICLLITPISAAGLVDIFEYFRGN